MNIQSIQTMPPVAAPRFFQPCQAEPADFSPVETFTPSTASATEPGRSDIAPAALSALAASGGCSAAQVAASLTPASVAGMIDHTLLKAEATSADIRKLCAEARENKFASVCVNPGQVVLAAAELQGTEVKVCTVVGFPLGATTTAMKAAETRDAIANGAGEIDMVINVGALKDADYAKVQKDIAAVVEAAGEMPVKVILETGLLSREEKIKACELSVAAGADFVKTSTGFGKGGATVEDIALMRETVGPDLGVKASGGVRDFATAQAMVVAGATRLGCSAGVAIIAGMPANGSGY